MGSRRGILALPLPIASFWGRDGLPLCFSFFILKMGTIADIVASF